MPAFWCFSCDMCRPEDVLIVLMPLSLYSLLLLLLFCSWCWWWNQRMAWMRSMPLTGSHFLANDPLLMLRFGGSHYPQHNFLLSFFSFELTFSVGELSGSFARSDSFTWRMESAYFLLHLLAVWVVWEKETRGKRRLARRETTVGQTVPQTKDKPITAVHWFRAPSLSLSCHMCCSVLLC